MLQQPRLLSSAAPLFSTSVIDRSVSASLALFLLFSPSYAVSAGESRQRCEDFHEGGPKGEWMKRTRDHKQNKPIAASVRGKEDSSDLSDCFSSSSCIIPPPSLSLSLAECCR